MNSLSINKMYSRNKLYYEVIKTWYDINGGSKAVMLRFDATDTIEKVFTDMKTYYKRESYAEK